MVTRKEASEYFQKHKKIHPEIVKSEVEKVKKSMVPELPEPEEVKEPEPEPEE
jgi:hypothetical protein